MNDWWEYVVRVCRGARTIDVAEQTDIPPATISRWNPETKGGASRPTADNVVVFARAYGRSPLEALISAGYIKAEEAGLPVEFVGSLSDVSDATLVDELADRLAEFRRIQRGGKSKDWPPGGWEN